MLKQGLSSRDPIQPSISFDTVMEADKDLIKLF